MNLKHKQTEWEMVKETLIDAVICLIHAPKKELAAYILATFLLYVCGFLMLAM